MPDLQPFEVNQLCCIGGDPVVAPEPPEDHTPCVLCVGVLSEILIKTFNNGSLGSGIDEERSEMR